MLDYLLSFAGIPLLTDRAQSLDLPDTYSDDYLELQEPLADLIDDLNRSLPFQYLQDFMPSECARGRNISNLARRSQFGQQPTPQIRINDWYYPTTASRWSVFRGLATGSMVKAILNVTKGSNPAPFVMLANPISPVYQPNNKTPYTLQSQMYMLPARPLGEHGKQFDGLYLITLVDERWYWQFSSVTLRVRQNTQWTDLLTQITNLLSVTITGLPAAVYNQPDPDSQLWTNMESAAFLLDTIAYNLGTCVTRALNGSYTLLQPSVGASLVASNRRSVAGGLNATTSVVRVAGGDLYASGAMSTAGDLTAQINSVLPAAVTVTFPKYIEGDDPVPHFFNTRTQPNRPSTWYEQSYGETYNITVPLLSGNITITSGAVSSGLTGTSGFTHTIADTAKALYLTEASASGAPLNQSGLTSLAMRLAQDYWNLHSNTALDEVYPGTFNWIPEGIHDIIWTYSERQRLASCRVMKTQWNVVVEQMQHGAVQSGNTTPKGVGGPSLALTVRDSLAPTSAFSGTTTGQFNSGDLVVTLGPAQNPPSVPWKALIDQEVMLISPNAVSGAVPGARPIIYRALDGTSQGTHGSGASVNQVAPTAIYGANLLTLGGGLSLNYGIWSSGGIQEAVITAPVGAPPILNSGPFLSGGTLPVSGGPVIGINNPPSSSGIIVTIPPGPPGQIIYIWNIGSPIILDGVTMNFPIPAPTGGIIIIYYDPIHNVWIPVSSPLLLAENVDFTQQTYPCFTLVANNSEGQNHFGRILIRNQGNGEALFDWQGTQSYVSGTGYVGPEPDTEYIGISGVIVNAIDEPLLLRTQVTIGFSGSPPVTIGSGSIGSGTIASGAIFSGLLGAGAGISGVMSIGSINSGNISSGVIWTQNIGSGAIQSGQIVSGALVYYQIIGASTNALTNYTGLTTSGFANVFDVVNTNGLHGSFSILNTSGVNQLAYLLTVIDMYGNITSGNSQSLGGGARNSQPFDSDPSSVTGGTPPFREAILAVKDVTGGSHTGYSVYLSLVG